MLLCSGPMFRQKIINRLIGLGAALSKLWKRSIRSSLPSTTQYKAPPRICSAFLQTQPLGRFGFSTIPILTPVSIQRAREYLFGT